MAFFVPPLYFLLRKKWLGFFINFIIFITALVTLIFGIGVLFCFMASCHAALHLRKENMAEHAQMIADKMAEKSNKNEQ